MGFLQWHARPGVGKEPFFEGAYCWLTWVQCFAYIVQGLGASARGVGPAHDTRLLHFGTTFLVRPEFVFSVYPPDKTIVRSRNFLSQEVV